MDDLALAAGAAAGRDTNEILNAIGPETFTYRELVQTIARVLGLKRLIVSVPPALGYWCCRVLGWIHGDVIITRDEIRGLMQNRLCVDAPALGKTKLSQWLAEHRDTLGGRYTSELARRTDRVAAYRSN